MEIQQVQRRLFCIFWAFIVITTLLIAFFETVQPQLNLPLSAVDTFWIVAIMEMLTICAIPVAMKLTRFSFVKKRITGINSLQKVLMLRLVVLAGLMVINTLLHYLLHQTALGYLAIVLLLSLVFIYPSLSRCQNEYEQTQK